jgi:uncharacterized protein YndB with AHSA1/START domain
MHATIEPHAKESSQVADITHSISIGAPVQNVFPLTATAEGFKQWWASEVSEDDATEIVELSFFKAATIYRLKPIKNPTPWTMEWLCESGQEWDGTTLLFAMKEAGGKTQLHFTHAGWQAESPYFVECTKTWGDLMLRLKAAAEGKKPGPFFTKDGTAS